MMEDKPTKITAEPGKQEIIVSREFNAPRGVVFKAFTDPKLYKEWIGPRGFETEIDVFESKDGGSWRYIQKDLEGNQFAFHGVNHEVLPPERIIGTFEFEGLSEAGHVILQAVYLESLPDNRTRMTNINVFLNVEDRDGMIQSGMEEGVIDSYNRLDELLEKMKDKLLA